MRRLLLNSDDLRYWNALQGHTKPLFFVQNARCYQIGASKRHIFPPRWPSSKKKVNLHRSASYLRWTIVEGTTRKWRVTWSTISLQFQKKNEGRTRPCWSRRDCKRNRARIRSCSITTQAVGTSRCIASHLSHWRIALPRLKIHLHSIILNIIILLSN